MPCCCTNTLNLCKASVCQPDTIIIGMNAPADGEYQLVLGYLGNDIIIRKTFVANDPLVFSALNLNEKYTYTGKIIDPDGNTLTVVTGEGNFDCVSFQTVLTYETEIVNP